MIQKHWVRCSVCGILVLSGVMGHEPLDLLAKDITLDLSPTASDIDSPSIELITPGEATTTTQTKISVKGIARNATSLKVNGTTVPVNEAGQFETSVDLPTLGVRTIQINAISKNGEQDSVFRSVRRLSPDKTNASAKSVGPDLVISQPENSFATSKEKAYVTGLVRNASRLMINDIAVNIDREGRYYYKLPLVVGENKVHVVAYDVDGASTEAWRTITRSSGLVTHAEVAAAAIAASASGNGSINAQSSDKEKFISMNLIDADIQQVITILSEKTGINFIGDSTLKGNITIHLKDVELTQALNLILISNGYNYQRIGDTIFVAQPERLANFKTQLIQVFQLKNIKAADAATILKTFISTNENESVQESSDENMLIIKASESTMKRLEGILEQIDRSKPQQAFIEVKVAEISKTDVDHMGLNWNTTGVATTYTLPLQQAFTHATLSDVSLGVGLDVLLQQSNAHVLATPRLSALNNKKASIFIGDKVSYTTTSTSTAGSSTTVQTIEVGIKLDMTPVINPVDNTIVVELSTEVSFISGFVSGVPQVQTRQAATTLRINDGETSVIGGLLSSKDSVSREGLPVLGNLPILGNLFTTNITDKSEKELIITITPKIVHI